MQPSILGSMDPALDEIRLGAWKSFLRSYRALIDVLEDELRCAQGLPLTWFDVLAQLHGSPGHRLRMKDLADSIVLSKSGLTRVMDRMVAAGLVARESCTWDRRSYEAVLTPEGERAFEQAATVHLDGIRRHFSSRLSDDEALALAQTLGKLLHPAPTPSWQ